MNENEFDVIQMKIYKMLQRISRMDVLLVGYRIKERENIQRENVCKILLCISSFK